ncbi:HNH endonuclease [Sphingobacterium faecale]|uniref:HNH endonuclease n=1 Tax=Sphingobacterium faecale TaxID=2803775 RepID=A0ABS1R346_9SPHI|nr:HNH endonuclease [Sphingobacterium faecale]MBL1408700.1 HNH endonuclease [Sphingobacterium faecale]
MIEHLPFYVHSFSKLKRDMKNGGAPHKPILLLAVIKLFEEGTYFSNQLLIVPELVASFKRIWSQLVITKHDPILALPFYHMRSEPFWELIANPGCEIWIESKSSMRSFNNLNAAVKCAWIDDDLVVVLSDPSCRAILKETLLDTYFSETKSSYVDCDGMIELDVSVLNETSEEYRQKIEILKRTVARESYQEEIFVRCGIFKREIPKLYNNTCAISGMRVDATINISLLDACHIVPFSEGQDDSISNGIALCPNLHRAFDRGIISISDDYRVIVKSNFVENDASPYSIKQFDGARISLPINEEHHPALENIAQHRKKMGF